MKFVQSTVNPKFYWTFDANAVGYGEIIQMDVKGETKYMYFKERTVHHGAPCLVYVAPGLQGGYTLHVYYSAGKEPQIAASGDLRAQTHNTWLD